MSRTPRTTTWSARPHNRRAANHFLLDAALMIAIVGLAFALTPRLSDAQAALQILRQMFAPQAVASTIPRENVSVPSGRTAIDPTQALIQQLGNGNDPVVRAAAKENLRQMPDAAIAPALFDALTNTDPLIRASVAEILAEKKPVGALDALALTTYDPEPNVRLAAVQALGEIASPLILPRLDQIQIYETDAQIRGAAQQAEKKIYARVAEELKRPEDFVRVIAVAPSNGRIYVATWDGLYVPRGMDWQMQSRLPDLPTALAVSAEDADTLYLGTSGLGVLKSRDSGKTWEQLKQSLPTPERTTVTAIAVSPTYPRVVFVALAAWFDTVEQNETPLGLYMSKDAGETWSLISKWPEDYVTLRLVIDPIAPNYLYGMMETGSWRFPLSKVYCEPC
ncbi:MAG: HEAT repeat domain-containing protein [Chloroflexi bacterium]|nr:HEAT repeat domain-containing protein [Chloroflexota bacterium]